jgi:hypothetical protein
MNIMAGRFAVRQSKTILARFYESGRMEWGQSTTSFRKRFERADETKVLGQSLLP